MAHESQPVAPQISPGHGFISHDAPLHLGPQETASIGEIERHFYSRSLFLGGGANMSVTLATWLSRVIRNGGPSWHNCKTAVRSGPLFPTPMTPWMDSRPNSKTLSLLIWGSGFQGGLEGRMRIFNFPEEPSFRFT